MIVFVKNSVFKFFLELMFFVDKEKKHYFKLLREDLEWTAWLAYEFGKNSEPLIDLLSIGYFPDFEPVSWELIVNF